MEWRSCHTSFLDYLNYGSAPASDPDLVFYMSFDKVSGDGVEDDSGNGNTGTLNGDAEIVKNGKFGSALSVSGAGHVDCGNAEILNQEFPGLTIEAWIYPEVLGGVRSITAKWTNTIETDHFSMALVEDKIAAAVADGVTAEQELLSDLAVKENEWNHIAITWNSEDNNHEVYIDGEL